jgi:glycosyltransferase involved in cell wall biosynthesis
MTTRVVWAMNVAPPYRLPVWDELAQHLDLEVWLLSANENTRRWAVPRDRDFAVRLLQTVSVRRGASVHYVLKQPLGRAAPRPDVLILPGWDSPAAWQLLWWAKRHGVQTLAFNESTLDSRRHTAGPIDLARRWFFRQVDGVLTVSPGSTAAVLATGVPQNRITQIVNAVDMEMIPAPSSTESPKAPDAPHVFLFCGRLIAGKQPTLVIQALASMGDNSRLLVAGEGPCAGEMTELVRRNELQNRVEFLGYINPTDVPDVFGRCDTLVFPSTQEAYGLVVTEALAAGLHAIVSERAGIAEVVRNMRGTWVTKPEVHSLTKCMTASKLEWTGRVQDPEARRHSPQVMAAEIRQAVYNITQVRPRRTQTGPLG